MNGPRSSLDAWGSGGKAAIGWNTRKGSPLVTTRGPDGRQTLLSTGCPAAPRLEGNAVSFIRTVNPVSLINYACQLLDELGTAFKLRRTKASQTAAAAAQDSAA